MLDNTEPKALVAEPAFAETAREAREGLRVITLGDAALLDGAPPLPCEPDRGLDAPLLIINTSGTTGPPRGAVLPPRDAYRLRLTAGMPVPHCRVRIASEDGSPVAAGDEGELLVKGPTVMREYRRNPEATGRAFHDGGWFRSGDVGVLLPRNVIGKVERDELRGSL